MIVRFVAILRHHLQLLVEERRPGSVLSLSVTVQLTKLVTAIAKTYGDPGFHRLSHALHVTTSLNKILSETTELTDALDKFSLVFAAFLHDAGHTGEAAAEIYFSLGLKHPSHSYFDSFQG